MLQCSANLDPVTTITVGLPGRCTAQASAYRTRTVSVLHAHNFPLKTSADREPISLGFKQVAARAIATQTPYNRDRWSSDFQAKSYALHHSGPQLFASHLQLISSESQNVTLPMPLMSEDKPMAYSADSEHFPKLLICGCIITFAPGLGVQHVVSSLNLHTVCIRGLPIRWTRKHVNDLLLQRGISSTLFIITKVEPTPDRVSAQAEILMDSSQIPCLSDLAYAGASLHVLVLPYLPAGSFFPISQSLPNTLHISWPAPCVDYIVNYLDEDDAFAQYKTDQLNGKSCAGRPVRVRVNTLPPGTREPPPYWRANSIAITDVPLWARDEDIQQFSGSPYVRRMEGRLFDAEAAVRWTERDLKGVTRADFQFELLSERADPVDGTVCVQATFGKHEDARRAKEQLEKKGCDYLARGKREVRMPDAFEYVADVTADTYAPRQPQWAALRDGCRKQDGCRLWMEYSNAGVRIHISGAEQASVGALKVRAEELIRGSQGCPSWSSNLDQLHSSYPDANCWQSSTGDCLSSCHICLDVISAPIFLECGHAYCRGCLEHFFSAAAASSPSADNGQQMFPLRCAQCETPVPISCIASVVGPEKLYALQKNAFESYISRHPKQLRWCPTPGCVQIYSLSSADNGDSRMKTDEYSQCPSCFVRICTTYRAAVEAEVEERETSAWVSQQSGRVAPCPSCGVLIEKGEGCNHVACRCGSHICWKCMRMFESKDVYRHMNEAHGGIGMVAPLPAINIAEQQEVLRQAEERQQQRRPPPEVQMRDVFELHIPTVPAAPEPTPQRQQRRRLNVDTEWDPRPVAFLNGYGPVTANELAEIRTRERRQQLEAERAARRGARAQRPLTWGGAPTQQVFMAGPQRREAQDDRGCVLM